VSSTCPLSRLYQPDLALTLQRGEYDRLAQLTNRQVDVLAHGVDDAVTSLAETLLYCWR
jgi:hypothetical protein